MQQSPFLCLPDKSARSIRCLTEESQTRSADTEKSIRRAQSSETEKKEATLRRFVAGKESRSLRHAQQMRTLLRFTLVSLVSLVSLLLLTACQDSSQRAKQSPTEQAAHRLEEHLLAPCCYRETLDVHTSPLTTKLRAEIRNQLASGQSPAQVEAALVQEYGAKMKVQRPEQLGSWLLLISVVVGGAALLWIAKNGLRNQQTESADDQSVRTTESIQASSQDAQYEWQLDQDLLDER